jgi:hypothetical protein
MRLKLLCVVTILTLLTGCARQEDADGFPRVKESTSYNKVYFNISDDIYYPVHIPDDLSYVTDNAKYIYADDNKLNVSVISGADYYKFSESVLTKNTETVKKNIVATKDWETMNVAEAAIYLYNDKAVRVHVEGNPSAFATILNGLQSEWCERSKYTSLTVPEDCVLDVLPIYTGAPEISAGLGGQLRKVYSLSNGEGSLSVSQEFRKFDEAIQLYEQRIATIADSDCAECQYKSDNIYYAEVKDYVVGVYKVNFNTVLTCYGVGDSAKLNTVFFLSNQTSEVTK